MSEWVVERVSGVVCVIALSGDAISSPHHIHMCILVDVLM